MEASNLLIKKIKEFEGVKLTAYKPVSTEKYWTIGYGHYGSDVKKGQKITLQKAEELLLGDLKKFADYVNTVPGITKQGQFDAVVDFCFNLGISSFAHSTLRKYIVAKKSDKLIQAQFQRWVYSGKVKLKGLVKRRAWEAMRWAQ